MRRLIVLAVTLALSGTIVAQYLAASTVPKAGEGYSGIGLHTTSAFPAASVATLTSVTPGADRTEGAVQTPVANVNRAA